MDSTSDPSVSAVVTLKDTESGPPDMDTVAKIKSRFSSTGFEVHAPFQTSFSIGARRSVFERVFGTGVKVDEESLGAAVTTEGGGQELPLDQLPDDLRGPVASVAFPPALKLEI